MNSGLAAQWPGLSVRVHIVEADNPQEPYRVDACQMGWRVALTPHRRNFTARPSFSERTLHAFSFTERKATVINASRIFMLNVLLLAAYTYVQGRSRTKTLVSGSLHRILFPNADEISWTPSSAVRFAMSRTGLTSTNSNESIFPESAIFSIARWLSRYVGPP
jgi:hypothetical protein